MRGCDLECGVMHGLLEEFSGVKDAITDHLLEIMVDESVSTGAGGTWIWRWWQWGMYGKFVVGYEMMSWQLVMHQFQGKTW